MKKAIIEIDSNQLLGALSQLPSQELKRIIKTLFSRGLYKGPNFDTIAGKVRKSINKHNVPPETVEEAVKWARRKR